MSRFLPRRRFLLAFTGFGVWLGWLAEFVWRPCNSQCKLL
jgi:hypothetical protein